MEYILYIRYCWLWPNISLLDVIRESVIKWLIPHPISEFNHNVVCFVLWPNDVLEDVKAFKIQF